MYRVVVRKRSGIGSFYLDGVKLSKYYLLTNIDTLYLYLLYISSYFPLAA